MSESTIKNIDLSYINRNPEVIKAIKNKNYRVDKSVKKFRLFTKDMAIDKIFNELEITKDKSGNIIDTRFNNEIQEFIRNYLKEKGYEFIDTGYQSLRAACYSLKDDDRLELCRYINYKFDKKIDIEKELKGTSFFNKLTNKAGIILSGTTLGLATGAVINKIKPETGANLIRDPLKEVVEKTINENVAPLFQGTVIDVANNLLDKKVLTESLPINLALFSSAGTLTGLAGSIISTAYGIINNIGTRIRNNKNYEKFLEIDNQKYAQDNQIEAETISKMLMEEENIKGK